ncbi:MAG: sulfatase-like hydrolase/transferase [Akkermansiaceae bacterium]
MNPRLSIATRLAAAVLSLLCQIAAARSPERPNILFILVDDYGLADVAVEGSTFYETPHIDRLARGGMRFTQGYSACRFCSPTRPGGTASKPRIEAACHHPRKPASSRPRGSFNELHPKSKSLAAKQ